MYEGEAGQSRQAAMKARLEALESVFSALREGPPAEAERLLQRIRTAGDVNTVLSGIETVGGSTPGGGFVSTWPDSLSTTREEAKREPDGAGISIHLELPHADITMQAVDSFFSSSGKLFHVFSREQTMRHFHDVFQGLNTPEKGISISCLAAVAAIGTQ